MPRSVAVPTKLYYAFAEVMAEDYGIKSFEELRLRWGIPKNAARKLWLGDMTISEFLYFCEALNIDPKKCFRQR